MTIIGHFVLNIRISKQLIKQKDGFFGEKQ